MVPAKSFSSGSFPTTGLAGVAIVLAALTAYHNSFQGPFIFDDLHAIADNPTLRHFRSALWPLHNGSGVDGRPLVNLSFAINYAAGGIQVWGFHAMNLGIHILAGLTLFGIVWRTLRQPVLRRRFGEAALPLAFAVALLWTVHPLLTEAVTYVIQRNESLMGLFYLLTLYCFIRGTESRNQESVNRRQGTETRNQQKQSELRTATSGAWLLLSVFSCFLGMASKEVMVSAPLIVLLYDRAFVAGTFRAAWRQRWGLYLGLGSGWLLLAYLMVGTNHRGNAVGFGLGVTWWEYALTQCQAIVHYLRLSFWPHPLIFDYGTDVVKQPGVVASQAPILLMLVAGTLVGLWRWPMLGFVGMWFFAILSPSSSVVPNTTQTMAEHRMYLPLAGVIALTVLGLYGLMGRRSLIIFAAMAAGLGWLTVQRNKDYHTEVAIWSDTVAKRPGNARAYNDLGDALMNVPGRQSEAIAAYETALQIKPNFPMAHTNLGCALANIPGRLPEAIGHFKAAFEFKPDYVIARNYLGLILYKNGRTSEAIAQFEEAVRIKPDYAEAYYNLGVALDKVGRLPEAISRFEEAVRIDPDYAEAHYGLGTSFARRGQIPEAISQLGEAVRIKPDYAEAHSNLGIALYQAGRIPEAIAQCKEVLRIKSDSAAAHAFLEKLQKVAK